MSSAQLEIGTSKWVEETGGKLRWADALHLLRPLPHQLVRYLSGRLSSDRRDLGLPNRRVLEAPDSRLARDALQEATELLPGFLLNHSIRTYCWGASLAELRSTPYDADLLYVSSLLHDVGLTKAVQGECFTARGATRAMQLAARRGVDPERARRIADAITLHCNPVVGDGTEAQLVHEGAALDVIGLRYHDLGSRTVGEVLERYPRLDFKREFSAAWRAESLALRSGRARLLSVFAAFPLTIRWSPFSE